jgi:hypothetical protein
MAAGDARPIPRKAQPFRATFPIWNASSELISGAAGLDSERSIDAGTFADCSSEATEIAPSSGFYYLDLTSSEMDGDTVALQIKSSSTSATVTALVIYPESLGDMRVDAVGSVTGNVGGNVVGSVGALSSVTGSVGSVTGNVAGNVIGYVGALSSVTGSVGSVTGAVGTFGTAAMAQVAVQCASSLAVYDGPTLAEMNARTIAAATYLTSSELNARTLATAGYLTSSELNARSIASASYLTSSELNARTLAATGYITSSELAGLNDLSSAEVQSGVAAALTAADLPTHAELTSEFSSRTFLTTSQVNAEVSDVLTVDTRAQPAQGAPAATASIAAKIDDMHKAWMNPKTQTSSELDIFNAAGLIVDHKAAVSDDGTTFTQGKIGSGP